MPGIEPKIEPNLEGNPESESWLYSISKYAGDFYMPPVVSEPPPMVIQSWISIPSWLGGGQVPAITRERFFSEVRDKFSHIPWTSRASRAREIAIDNRRIEAMEGTTPADRTPYMEDVEQRLISKFRGEDLRDTVYRTKREKERKDGQKKEFTPRVLSKEQFLEDLENRISSVQWREKNPNHGAKVGARPGIRKQFQQEIDHESY